MKQKSVQNSGEFEMTEFVIANSIKVAAVIKDYESVFDAFAFFV